MTATRTRLGLAQAVAIVCVLALVVATAVWWLLYATNQNKVTAYFSAAVGLYPGSDVRVLGVRVGSIDTVTPQGTTVKVEMSVDKSIRVPANAQAVVVSPSVVSDRYVQLTPVYTGGAVMADNATIPRERTATPVELDQLYQSLDKLTTTLGPNGANKNGALSDLLNTAAANLAGNGQNLNDTIKQLGQATSTLAGSKDDLFGTVDNLQKFVTTLAQSDQQVRTFNDQLAQVSGYLASERTDLGDALSQLSTALGQVQGFIADNRSEIKSNVDKLADVTKVLVDQRAALAESLDVAPLALGNLQNTYNAASGTLDTRADINELTQPPITMVCNLIKQTTPKNVPQVLSDACGQLAGVLNKVLPLPSAAQVIESLQQGKLPPLPVPMLGQSIVGGEK
ncbi:MCE family protein [Kutzneria buriramensis]|uniref:Virulence factor Mce-like protein n=1 Tax=Kutzneria buriramensis TaxID=1045776 RepID=A0A3E0I9R7_9PSEU|nr:MCE family protein [Kutzneria buriramensis]REH55478.1 virulence factor Mce-like protein [Kutzneria buriramensis]